MSECKNCGREDGHWIGCTSAARDFNPRRWVDDSAHITQQVVRCAFDGCTELRRTLDKRVKFCEFHSDPKNRK